MAYKMGVTNPPEQLSRRGARRTRRSASRRWKWPTSTRRSPTAAGATADRDHQGRVPRRPRRHAAGASRIASRCSPKASTAEETSILHQNVSSGTAGALGDRLPDGGQDRHDERTGRRLARRLHAELLDGRVDGLPEQAGLDDRRPRRAAAGRLPAGGNLARLHVGGHRRPAVQRIPAHPTKRSPTSRSTATTRPPARRSRTSEATKQFGTDERRESRHSHQAQTPAARRRRRHRKDPAGTGHSETPAAARDRPAPRAEQRRPTVSKTGGAAPRLTRLAPAPRERSRALVV